MSVGGPNLFELGVGAMADSSHEDTKFAADKMLGRLVKWLRIIGQDVIYGAQLSGYGLIRTAQRENRLILTRDRGLRRKNSPAVLLIKSDRFRDQLKQVIREYGLDPFAKSFTRCVECNTLLEPMPKENVEGKVPPHVFSTEEKFSFCRRCQKIYWSATHQQKMVDELRSLGFN